ncbi:YhcN/YlaJ family sporulation lipoprotein [Caldibacillus debilis]|uniref:YhcN/YlaJ family sporulation lipoprotein n=1 Tax=Caldibacillus debilis TaxID=301148 RepID=A0A150LQ33_9BACI|nr:YhcN/YlaJ family sporulation lipoprotein [Caldibacillus debilis]KYD14361.1 hypothetical protein B4135_2788 [Caldibacillus debilis]
MKNRILFLSFLFLLLSSGCMGGNNAPEKQGYFPVKNRTENTGETVNENREENVKTADHLAELAAAVNGVKNARAVVLGRFAVVGIDVDKDLERSEVGTIKYAVAEVLRNDPRGANAVIVADPDLNARLDEMRKDIIDGRPVNGIMEELADIVGRVMPEVPGDLDKPVPKDPAEREKETPNDGERQNPGNGQERSRQE